ncbi:unnamed protein product [Paramecium sonneborni]|uniref:Uncharacterized protein n=1 Tax=Paramecium sonneborni TaxID=65129 RepID=A0A8S1NWQ6_9CILI|nr:unnamed protein product [Paramecium sonneborni]
MNKLNKNAQIENYEVNLEKGQQIINEGYSFSNFVVKEIQQHPQVQGIIAATNSMRINKGGKKNQNFRDSFTNRQLGYQIQFNSKQEHNLSFLGFYNIVLFPELQNKSVEIKNEFQSSSFMFGTLEIFYYFVSAKINYKEIQNVKLQKLIKPEEKFQYSDCWILALWQYTDYFKLINFYNNLVDIGSSYVQIQQIFDNFEIILKLLQLYCRQDNSQYDIFSIESEDDLDASFSTIDSLSIFEDSLKIKQQLYERLIEDLFKNQSDQQVKQEAITFCQQSFLDKVTGFHAFQVAEKRIVGLTNYLYRITMNLIEDRINDFLSNKYQILKLNQFQQNLLYIHLSDYDEDEKQQNQAFQLLMDCLLNETLKTLSIAQGTQQVKSPFEIWIQENSLNKKSIENLFGKQEDKDQDSGLISTKFIWHQNPVIYRIQGFYQLMKFDITPNEKKQILLSQQIISQKDQNNDVINMLTLVKQQYEYLKQFQKVQEQEIIVQNIPKNLEIQQTKQS